MTNHENILGGLNFFTAQTGRILIYVLVALFVMLFFYRWYRNKEIFKYPVKIFRRRAGDRPKSAKFKAGYIKDKRGVPIFRIKLHRYKFWMRKDLYSLPDSKYMDGDGTVYYYQLDPFTFHQLKFNISTDKMPLREVEFVKNYSIYKKQDKVTLELDEANKLVDAEICKYPQGSKVLFEERPDHMVFEPIPNDIKAITVNDIQQVESTIAKDTTKQVAIITGGLVILAISFLIAFYFLTNTG